MAVNNYKKDEGIKETINIEVVSKLFKYLKSYKLQVVQVMLLMGVVTAVELCNPYFLKIGIDNFIANKDIKGLLILGLIAVAINLIAMIGSTNRIRIMSGVSNGILLTIRQQLYTHIQKLSFSFFDSRPVGKILARIMGDVNSLGNLFSDSVSNLIPDLLTIVAVMIIMLINNIRLGLVSLATLPFLILTMAFIQTRARKRWQSFKMKTSNMNAFTHEDFSGMRVVQSFTAEKRTKENFHKLQKDYRNAFISAVRIVDGFWPIIALSSGISTALVFWVGVNALNTGTITKGLLVMFVSYNAMLWVPISRIGNFYNSLILNASAAERIFEVLGIEPEVEDDENAVEMPTIKGDIAFNGVSFGYDEDKMILKDVSFNVEAGETIALVGPTGVGKTTIVNLIARFYDCQAGEVTIDGYNVKNIVLETLRSQMGIMMQDTFLFSGSIKENIRYGKLDASDEEIIEVSKRVNAHEFIMKLESGYDTRVNERGSRLSVGQRQLIAFARALLANPRILILDEATASIDTHTERLVQKGIQELLSGRTSLVIAHRLSTIQHANRIMVIDHGKISEMGSHDELMKYGGLYYKLFMAQYKFLEDDNVV